MPPILIATGFPPGLNDIDGASNRAPGVHASDIIYSIALRLGYKKQSTTFADHTRNAFMILGSALEHAIAYFYFKRFPGRYLHQPGEYTVDYIHGNPDLIDCEFPAVEEIKLTWASATHDILSDQYWHYWVQVKTYCYMVGLNTGRLHIVNITGGGEFGFGPAYRVWEWVFTDEELKQNWAMMVNNRDKVAEELQSKKDGVS